MQLKIDKNHKRFLRKFILSLNKFWSGYKIGFLGIQIRIAGKLNGKMRKSKYQYRKGWLKLQTITNFLSYNLSISYTKFGILSVKVWILYENTPL
jgi:ribosomal protein S3